MEYKEFKPVIIATMVMIAMLGALCIATPAMANGAGCDDLDQDLLKRYDFDNNGLIGSDEMEKAKIGYESNYEKPDDYAQILYAYEHRCSVRCSGGYSVFQVVGYVYLGTATVSGADVTVTNLNTNESLTVTTDSNGVYLVPLGNLPNGHSAGDIIQVTATYNGMTGTNSAPRSENLSDSPQIIDVTIAVPSGGGGGGGGAYPIGWGCDIIRAGDGSCLPTSTPVGETFTVLITEDGSPVGAGTIVIFTLPYDTGDPVYCSTDDSGKVNYKPWNIGTLGIRVLDGTVAVAEATVEVTTIEIQTLGSITISPDSPDPLNIGGSLTFTAVCRDTNSGVMTCPTLTWTSSNSTVGTITAGEFTAIIAGTTTIITVSAGVTSNAVIVAVNAVPSRRGGGGGSFGSCVEVRGTIAELDSSNYTIASSAGNPLYVADTCCGQPGLQWDYSSFAGFWYDLDDDMHTETLAILANERHAPMGDTLRYPYDREIGEGSLIYTTHPVFQEYELHANEADPDRTTQTAMEAAYDDLLDQPIGLCVESDNAGGDCGYFIEGWMGEKYVAIDNNADKLCKLLVEFEDDDMKTLTVGEEWDMGGGYSLNAKQLDLEGNKVWFVLKKDGREIDNEVASTGDIDRPQERVYTYTADLAQEYDIPVFSCYVNTIFRGDDSWVEIMYVFLIDEDVLEIETSDTYGSMEVSTASSTWIVLDNDETTIDLGIDNTEHIMGNIYFKTADDGINDHIRFYPIVKYAISADDSDHDTDSDGVPDVWDADNSTPAGYWVNSDGVGRMWGDMNGDGVLTSVDALMILQAVANGIKL